MDNGAVCGHSVSTEAEPIRHLNAYMLPEQSKGKVRRKWNHEVDRADRCANPGRSGMLATWSTDLPPLVAPTWTRRTMMTVAAGPS